MITLKEYLATHKHKGFNPLPHYFRDGDYVTYFAKDDRCFSRQIGPYGTIHISEESGEVIGITIHGITNVAMKPTT